jgi:hypothetical protein
MKPADPFDFAELPPLAPPAAASLAALQPPDPALLGPIAPGTVALIRGPRGAGKSWLALAMAHAIANGGSLLGWQGRAAPVLYVEAAMSGALLGARLHMLGTASALHVLCDEPLDLTGDEDQARLLDALPEGGLLVLDGLALVTRPGGGAWNRFARWLRMLRRAGHAVILVEPTARPALAALADTLVTLKPHQGEGDVGFAVAMASRLSLPAADRGFVADLALTSGRAAWTRSSAPPAELRAVIEAARGGGTVRDIATILGLPPATAWRRMDKARALGLLDRDGETGETPDPAGTKGQGAGGTPPGAQRRETGETPRTDLAAVSTAVLKRTLARRAEVPAWIGQNRPGPAILAGYDDAELAAECARRKPPASAIALAAE